MSISPVKIGIIGCGNISDVYFRAGKVFEILDIVACASRTGKSAEEKAAEFDIPKACSVDEIMADPEIELVVNLTVPQAHAEIGIAALEAGKSIYNEKPLSITRENGLHMLHLAKKKGLLVGCAPDTFLGAGIQSCRRLIDRGAIGQPVAATAFMMCHGHESWHPSPEFYYKIGGGPMFDMGPYYLTALINLIGPVRRVTGSARVTFPERMITSQPKYGTKIKVEVPTHVAGVLDFADGAIGTIITSFDVWHANLPKIEIYGTEGTISTPDPNRFDGSLRIRGSGDNIWNEIQVNGSYPQNNRGIGIADMANALRTGRPHRASGELAYHVLDIMHAIHDSSGERKHVELSSTCIRPAALHEDDLLR